MSCWMWSSRDWAIETSLTRRGRRRWAVDRGARSSDPPSGSDRVRGCSPMLGGAARRGMYGMTRGRWRLGRTDAVGDGAGSDACEPPFPGCSGDRGRAHPRPARPGPDTMAPTIRAPVRGGKTRGRLVEHRRPGRENEVEGGRRERGVGVDIGDDSIAGDRPADRLDQAQDDPGRTVDGEVEAVVGSIARDLDGPRVVAGQQDGLTLGHELRAEDRADAGGEHVLAEAGRVDER